MEHEILTPQIVEMIVGATAVVGGILIIAGLLLSKALGFIHFGKKKDSEDTELKVCPSHEQLVEGQERLSDENKALAEQLKLVSNNQSANTQKHEQHQKSFEAGEKKMKRMSCDIKHLCIGVAVLLDRQPNDKKKIEGVNLDVGSLIKALTMVGDSDV